MIATITTFDFDLYVFGLIAIVAFQAMSLVLIQLVLSHYKSHIIELEQKVARMQDSSSSEEDVQFFIDQFVSFKNKQNDVNSNVQRKITAANLNLIKLGHKVDQIESDLYELVSPNHVSDDENSEAGSDTEEEEEEDY